jgi:hypothetical protein
LCFENGVESTEYVVHTEFAGHYSKVFRDAFDSNRIEGQPLTYRLEDTMDCAVRLLVKWIYTQSLDGAYGDNDYDILVELWILANKLCMTPLQNLVIDKLPKAAADAKHWDPIIDSIATIYKKTLHGSVLRRFAVENGVAYIIHREFSA